MITPASLCNLEPYSDEWVSERLRVDCERRRLRIIDESLDRRAERLQARKDRRSDPVNRQTRLDRLRERVATFRRNETANSRSTRLVATNRA